MTAPAPLPRPLPTCDRRPCGASAPVRAALLGALLGLGMPAAAQPAPARSSAVGATPPDATARLGAADAAFRAGTLAFRRGDYPAAVASFREANGLVPHPDTLYNLGRALEAAGSRREALEVFAQYLDLAPTSSDAPEVGARLRALREAPVAVLVRSVPDGAAVRVDGAEATVCRTPCPVSLPPGEHTLVLARPGFRAAAERITVRPATSDERTVTLVAEAPVAPPVPTPTAPPWSRRRRPLAVRAALLGGFAWPRDRPDPAIGVEVTAIALGGLSAQFHFLAIDTDDTPRMFAGEVGWTFALDDIDLGVLLSFGSLSDCAACREGSLRRDTVQFVGGVTLHADVLLHRRLSLGIFARFGWRNFAVDEVDALLSSLGLSISFHL